MFGVSKEKEESLRRRMHRWGIREKDLKEEFIRSSGPGGQNVNKVSTCVFLVHLPTGAYVKCQKTRTQSLNRFYARRLLCDEIERRTTGIVKAEKQRVEKIRRQKRKRSKRAKEKMLENKKYQSRKKEQRRRISVVGDEGL